MSENLIDLSKEYRENGYLHFKGFFDDDIIMDLKKMCSLIISSHLNITEIGRVHESHSKIVNRYFPRTHSLPELDSMITTLINEFELLPLLQLLCGGEIELDADYTILSWLPEHIQKGFTGYHQDGPEDIYKDGNPHIWVPIEDDRNVNIRLIPGSHNFGNFPHGMFGQFVKVLPEWLTPFEYKAKELKVEVGDLLIFSTRILHCLTLNHSNKTCWSLEFMCKAKRK